MGPLQVASLKVDIPPEAFYTTPITAGGLMGVKWKLSACKVAACNGFFIEPEP